MSAAHHAMVKRIRRTYDFDLHAWKCEGEWEAQAEAWPKDSGHSIGRKVFHSGVERLGAGDAYNCDTQAKARTVAVFRADAVADELEAAMQRLSDAADAEFNTRCGL